MWILLVLQMTSSHPRLTPAAAAEVLRKCACLSNIENRPDLVHPLPARPNAVFIPGRATDGPLGGFPAYTPIAPLSHNPYDYVPFFPYPVVGIYPERVKR